MKSHFTITILIVLLFSIISCKKEEIVIDASDVAISMHEYIAGGSLNNNQIIGAVEATTNEGSLSFSILEQTPKGAIKVNAISGLITVANRNLFDYETNKILTAIVKVENGEVFKDINIVISLVDITSDNPFINFIGNYNITMDENPTTGRIVTAVHINSSGSVSLAITEQTPNNAFELQDNNLVVSDASLFDYETIETMSVTLTATLGELQEEINVQVTLNNVSPEFSEPIVLIENIDAWNLEYNGNLLYFITSGNQIASLDITNPSEGVVDVLSLDPLSNITVHNDNIYIVSSPYFKKYNVTNSSLTTISDLYYYLSFDEWVYAYTQGLVYYNDYIYFSYFVFDYNGYHSVLCRFNEVNGEHEYTIQESMWNIYNNFLISDNILYLKQEVGEFHPNKFINSIDLNSDFQNLEYLNYISYSEVYFGPLFTKGDYIYSVNGNNEIRKYSLTDIPSGVEDIFEFNSISFKSVVLIDDVLYFTDNVHHTLSKIEINFDD